MKQSQTQRIIFVKLQKLKLEVHKEWPGTREEQREINQNIDLFFKFYFHYYAQLKR